MHMLSMNNVSVPSVATRTPKGITERERERDARSDPSSREHSDHPNSVVNNNHPYFIYASSCKPQDRSGRSMLHVT